MEKKRLVKKLVLKKQIEKIISKTLITIIIVLALLIEIKNNSSFKNKIFHNIYEENLNFIMVRNIYDKYIGNIIPLKNIIKEEKPVFNEKLSYKKDIQTKNGVELIVDKNYLVPTIESGVVVFIGEKKELGKTIIIEQVNGVACIYSNINFIDINLYDYIEKGKLIGEAIDSKIFLSFAKEGEYLDYKKYI